MSNQAQVTRITKCGSQPLLSKRISLALDGRPQSDGSHCRMSIGIGERVTAATASDLAELIEGCSSNQAIALGSLGEGIPSPVEIVAHKKLTVGSKAIARSRANIDYRPGNPAWVLIDVDVKGMTDAVKQRVDAAGGIWEVLAKIAPGLTLASRVSRASTSSGLSRADTGETFPSSGGFHHYILLKDGSDAARFLKDLHDCCWQHGFGWHIIGAAGDLLERSLVDKMVGYGERLCFEGQPVVDLPLIQDIEVRKPQFVEAGAIDSTSVVPALSTYDRGRVDETKRASADALNPKAAEVRAAADEDLAKKLTEQTGVPFGLAMRWVGARHNGVLFPHAELEFDDHGTVQVQSVLNDPAAYVGETLSDPIEGIAYGRCKALVMQAKDGSLFIHSFAHGRTFYRLRHNLVSAKAALTSAPSGGMLDFGVANLASAELNDEETADFARTVAAAAGINLRIVEARFKMFAQQRQLEKQAASENSQIDRRIVRDRPQYDEEIGPTARFVDDALADDTGEEPPMRDIAGNIVAIRTIAPTDLHALLEDDANEDGSGSSMQPPVEPIIAQLTAPQVNLLIERRIAWRVDKKDRTYLGALNRSFIDSIMQFERSKMPVVVAINTAPLVSMRGVVIDGDGLDRENKMFHRIDPELRGCVPANPPSDEEMREALRFLLDEWLVDVALDAPEKCVTIMLALTLIQRALLPERPAFFVVAGQRGGGKTTLVQMVVTAVLGRRAAAAGWSGYGEERKKALFSFLRQGVAIIAWDNIPRGEAISCPHIEAALTSASVTDRVLGASKVETVPSTAVHVFTGNMISPRGDMASRSLIMHLEVERPDPENRTFKHADPIGWSLANRSRIVTDLYKILVGGAHRRPPGTEGKTRFKTWWRSIGWPVECAASLLCIDVDCTELMRAGETGDEEATAAAGGLSLLYETFGIREFTSADIVKAITVDSLPQHFSGQQADQGIKAQALTDAMAELAGRRLDRPTAHTIGKVLQKRLVGRPAWIGDGQTVAQLDKTAGHQANAYRIRLVEPKSKTAQEQKISQRRYSLLFGVPVNDDGDWEPAAGLGNAGKEGNVSGAAGAGAHTYRGWL